MTVEKKAINAEILDGLLAGYKKPEDLIGGNGLLKQLTKPLVERGLDAEMAEHLGHGRHEPVANPAGNTRNGKSRKTLRRQDPVALRTRHDGARDSGTLGRDVRRRGLADADFVGHRCGDGRGQSLARPAARHPVSGGLSRLHPRQGPRRRRGAGQGGVQDIFIACVDG